MSEYTQLLGAVVSSADGFYMIGAIGPDFITVNGMMNGYSRKSETSADFPMFDKRFKFIDAECQRIWDRFKQ